LLTGRTDNFINNRPDLDDTIRRLTAFAEAGADVLYAPGLPDLDAIQKVAKAVAPKPINVVMGPASGPLSLAQLAEAGVKRVSTGGALYRLVMASLGEAAKSLAKGDISSARPTLTEAAIVALLPKS